MHIERGFSLLEMVVVLGLLLLVLAIALPNLLQVRDRGSDSEVQAAYQRVTLALETYRTRCGQYPAANNNQLDLSASNGCNGIVLGDVLAEVPDIPHTYIALSIESVAGVCDLGYVLAFQVSTNSPLLNQDHDYDASPGNIPYYCTAGDAFSGDDGAGWYDVVYPQELSL